ncbi:AGAP008254-PA, partial [Anopheles gambiae str. PEST]
MGPTDKLTTADRRHHHHRTMTAPPPARWALGGVTMCLLLLTASVVQTGPVIRSRRM